MPIGPDDVLCSNIQQEAGTLIVQFDGSCHADKGVGGAGAGSLIGIADTRRNSPAMEGSSTAQVP